MIDAEMTTMLVRREESPAHYQTLSSAGLVNIEAHCGFEAMKQI